MTRRQATRRPKTQTYQLRDVQAAVCRIAERKIAAAEASTPGEARENLIRDLELIAFLLTPGVLAQAFAKAAA